MIKKTFCILLSFCLMIIITGCNKNEPVELPYYTNTMTDDEINQGIIEDLPEYEENLLNNITEYTIVGNCETMLFNIASRYKNETEIGLKNSFIYNSQKLSTEDNEKILKKLKLNKYMIPEFAIALPLEANSVETYIVLNIAKEDKDDIINTLNNVFKEYNYALYENSDIALYNAINNPYVYYNQGYLTYIITTEDYIIHRFNKLLKE